MLLSYATGLYFAISYGLVASVWHVDFTHITSLIALLFTLSIGYVGYATHQWEINNDRVKANARALLMHSSVFVLTLLGLLGTIIGLMAQVRAMGSLDVSNPQNIVVFIATIGASLSTALYCTAVGIIASIGLIFANGNLEYFLDLKDE